MKGWLDSKGKTHEKVYDVVWAGDRRPASDGRLPPVGNTVRGARYTNSIGQSRSTTEECRIEERLVLESEQERTEVGRETKGRSTLHREESKLSDTNKVRRLHSNIKEQSDEEDIEALSKSRESSYDTQRLISDTHSKPENGADFWAFEPSMGRVADGIPDWVDRIKGLGNAIVPQVARVVMERIKPLI